MNCLGFPCEDGLPTEEERVGRDYEIVPGGSAVNFARFAQRLGFHAILAGKVGADSFGQVATQMLRESGIALAVQQDESALTNLGINFVSSDGVSVMASVGSSSELLTESNLSAVVDEYSGRLSYIYLGGCFKVPQLLPYFEQLAKAVGGQGITVILDHGRIPNNTPRRVIESMRSLVGAVDVYLPSRNEFLTLWDANTLESAAQQAFSSGVRGGKIVAVKDGAAGTVGFTADTCVQVRAYPVEVRNTVGAGDSFNAGFIIARSLNFDLEDCLYFACATAAIKISTADLPTRESVERFRINSIDGSPHLRPGNWRSACDGRCAN